MTTGSPSLAPGCPVTTGGYDAPPEPLGPDSLTWELFGDWRGLLQGPWAGSMQNMHPQLGAAVEQHSIFFTERMPRLLRSLYPIGGVVFDGDRAPQTGARGARLSHRHQGRRRSRAPLQRAESGRLLLGALDVLHGHHPHRGTLRRWPDRGAEAAVVRRAHHVVPHVRDEHAAGAQDVGGVPGLLGSHVPQRLGEQLRGTRGARSIDDAQTSVAAMDSRLAVASAAESVRALRGLAHGRPLRPGGAGVDGLHVVGARRAAAPAVRQAGEAVSFKMLPRRRRYHPRARAGWDRATGRIPADAPLVHTPARNLPPLDARDNGMHYCPKV